MKSILRELLKMTSSVYPQPPSTGSFPRSDLAENPRPLGYRKLTGSKNDWRIRIGDYRVLYEIDEKAKAVRIMRVRHRREVYRR
jgi:mRNA-degrading endonuclease RelE of RelBE toxin-antitoxin system